MTQPSIRGSSIARRRGAVSVELAIVAPLLFVMLAGLVEFGQAFRIQHILSTASRRSARCAIVSGATTSSVKAKAQNLVMTSLGLKAQDVVVTVLVNGNSGIDVASAKEGDEITVKTQVAFAKAGVGFFSGVLGNSDLSATCVLEHE